MIEYFMPSEIARLVLGYLKEIGCVNSANLYLSECLHLKEYVECLKNGNEYPTTIGGKNLLDVLKEYSCMKANEKQLAAKLCSNDPNKGDDIMTCLKSLSDQCVLHPSQKSSFAAQLKKPTQWAVVAGYRQADAKDAFAEENISAQSDKQIAVTGKFDNFNKATNFLHCATQTAVTEIETVNSVTTLETSHTLKHSTVTRKDAACSPIRQNSPIGDNANTPEHVKKCLASYTTPVKGSGNEDGNFRTPRRKSQLPRKRHGSTPQSSRKRPALASPYKDENVEMQGEENIEFSVLLDQLMNNTALHEKIAENINKVVKPSETNEREQQAAQVSLMSVSTNEEVSVSETVIKDIINRTESDPAFEELMNTLYDTTLKMDGNVILDANSHLNLFDKFCNEITAMEQVQNPSSSDESADTAYSVVNSNKQNVNEVLDNEVSKNDSDVGYEKNNRHAQCSETASPSVVNKIPDDASQDVIMEHIPAYSNAIINDCVLLPNKSPSLSQKAEGNVEFSKCSTSADVQVESIHTANSSVSCEVTNVCQESESASDKNCTVKNIVMSEHVAEPVQKDSTASPGTAVPCQRVLMIPPEGIQQLISTAETTNLVSKGDQPVPSVMLQHGDNSFSNLVLITTPTPSGVQNFQLLRLPVSNATVTPTSNDKPCNSAEKVKSRPTVKRKLKTLSAKQPTYHTPIMPKQKVIASRALNFHQPTPKAVITQPSVTCTSTSAVRISTSSMINSGCKPCQPSGESPHQQQNQTTPKSPQLLCLMDSIGRMMTDKQVKPGKHVRALEFGSPPKSIHCKVRAETSVIVGEMEKTTSSATSSTYSEKKEKALHASNSKNSSRKKDKQHTVKEPSTRRNILGKMDVDQFLSTLHYVE